MTGRGSVILFVAWPVAPFSDAGQAAMDERYNEGWTDRAGEHGNGIVLLMAVLGTSTWWPGMGEPARSDACRTADGGCDGSCPAGPEDHDLRCDHCGAFTGGVHRGLPVCAACSTTDGVLWRDAPITAAELRARLRETT